ncbi:hypothetical protein CEUSTIGMA_g3547.t1 [Chlamydomonas eustigma]|uniref:tRNA threonylcarbamoyladenosine biosynthesis protein TsaE n=1 Tax=Chlamydomonas eustigma TaxID=1157962 RepID=A0A250WZ33_9CHLO|nr:hypothetical protein CEUSTIGMA_g3547.t1 [Chlamydomonas eustigma]|eukprot:GAX76104.1 hypothetical protein CEUSTIGMA_g3547.t1 [Chlamydomonas eustigma]
MLNRTLTRCQRNHAERRVKSLRRKTQAVIASGHIPSSVANVVASSHSALVLYAINEEGMAALASAFSTILEPGDCYCLYGSVGAGKSVWSRAFIRAASDDPSLPVPSPTFLLQNTYDQHGLPEIHHFDLYRLQSEHEMMRLDLNTSFKNAVCLIEWPERLGSLLPQVHMAVHISILDEDEVPLSMLEKTVQGVRLNDEVAACSLTEDIIEEDVEFYDQRCRRVEFIPCGQKWSQRLTALKGLLSHKQEALYGT